MEMDRIINNLKLKDNLQKAVGQVASKIETELETKLKENNITTYKKLATEIPKTLHFKVCDIEVRVTYDDILRRLTELKIEPNNAQEKDIKDAMLYLVFKQTEVK